MLYTIVTGASSGLGEEFAKQLAKGSENTILVARRKDKLDALAQKLRDVYKVKVEVLALDLSEPSSAQRLLQEVEQNNWEIGGLINNAGIGDKGAFTEIALDRQLKMIQLNVTTLVELTYLLLPKLRKQQQSYVINVASTAAFQAGPNMSIYYATKAFVLSFSEGLYEELKAKGVQVSALCPGATASEFALKSNMTDTKLFKAGVMTSESVVTSALKKRRNAIVITGWKNVLGVWLGKVSPRSISRKIAGWLQA